jgi:hypothetical protein
VYFVAPGIHVRARPFRDSRHGERGRFLHEVSRRVDAQQIGTTMRQNLGRINSANLKRAHAPIESGATIGKIVLVVF